MLAVKTWNSSINDPDLLFQPRLVLQDPAATFQLAASTTARARLLLDGAWSPMSEGAFQVAVPASRDNLRIAEIQYHPGAPTEAERAAGFQDADEFEFVEIVNIGSQAIDLSEVRFARLEINGNEQGVDFNFADAVERELAAGERMVVVENIDAFRQRYGHQIVVAGEWSGGLDNRSETITLQLGSTLLQQLTYDSRSYVETAGLGASLEFYRAHDVALEDWGRLDNWRPSIKNGTPGRGPTPAPGDLNDDGRFSTEDLVLLGQRGEFEDGIAGNSEWSDGDFDGDGDVTTSDLVFAFTYSLFSDRVVAADPGEDASERD